MFPLLQDERIYAYLPGKPPTSENALRDRYAFLSRGRSPDGHEHWLNWILHRLEGDEPIGFIQATVSPPRCLIAYVLHPDAQGHGYATEATVAVIDHLFTAYPIDAVTAEIHVDNVPSIALVKRLGFTWVRHDAEEADDVYELPREAWQHP